MHFRLRRTTKEGTRSLLLGGTLVGLCATQALDWLSIVLYEHEDAGTRRAEDATRGYLHAYERAVAKVAPGLERIAVRRWGWRFHKAFGLLGGLGYLALRRRYPKLGIGLGLAFGAAFFVGVDELMVPLLGLTPGPRAFSWKVHARGAASHLLYGVAAETVRRAIALA